MGWWLVACYWVDVYQWHCSGVGNGTDAVQHLINNLHEWAECTVSKFGPDTKLGMEEVFDVLEDRAAFRPTPWGMG